MNIELGLRLTDSNYEYDNLTKTENMSTSFESHSSLPVNKSIFKKNFLNKLFFFWSTKAMKISNKKKTRDKTFIRRSRKSNRFFV